jgi:hypothetical protein
MIHFDVLLVVVCVFPMLVMNKCIVFNGNTSIDSGTNDARVCIAGLHANDSTRSFVTHSWNAPLSSPATYSIVASLFFLNESCSGVRLRRTDDDVDGTVVFWSVVVCRDDEIRNVWRGDLNYPKDYLFDGYSNFVGTAVNVTNNALILGSFTFGWGNQVSRDDFGCVAFTPAITDTITTKKFGVRFAYNAPFGDELAGSLSHVQAIDWNPAAARILAAPSPSSIPFATACGIGLDTTLETNFASFASVFNPSDRSIAIDAQFRSNVSLASQYVEFADNLATVIIDAVILNHGTMRVDFRAINQTDAWSIVLGTSNLLAVPGMIAPSITDVAVVVGVDKGRMFIQRETGGVDLRVHVATIIFRQSTTPSPTVNLSLTLPSVLMPPITTESTSLATSVVIGQQHQQRQQHRHHHHQQQQQFR